METIFGWREYKRGRRVIAQWPKKTDTYNAYRKLPIFNNIFRVQVFFLFNTLLLVSARYLLTVLSNTSTVTVSLILQYVDRRTLIVI